MSISTYSILALVFGGLGAIVGFAMLLLVVWQASYRLESILMACYMATVAIWGVSVAGQHLVALLDQDPTNWLRVNAFSIILAGPILFCLTSYYTKSWQKRWVRLVGSTGLVINSLAIFPLFAGWLITDTTIDSLGRTSYTILPLGYMVFALFYSYYLGTVILLIRHWQEQNKFFVAGGLIISVGTLITAFANPTLSNYPISNFSATLSALLFAYAILHENIFNPLKQLNLKLEQTNNQLSQLTQDAQENEANLRSLLENTTDLVWSIDADHCLLTINTTASDFFALIYNHQLEVGENVLRYLPKEAKAKWLAFYERAFGGERFAVEQRYEIGTASSTITLEISFNPIYNKDHHIHGVSIFGRDVTKRTEFERQLKLQALTFENLSESVIITNLEGYITDCNAATETIFGYTQEELIGQMPEIWHDTEETGTLTHNILSGLERKGRWDGEIRFVRKDGRRGICEAAVLPLYDETGERIAALGVSRDITKDRQHERELQEAKEAAEAANRAKSAFLASMSHELRTPLNAIIGYGEMLVDIADEYEYDEIAPDLERITTAGQHLLSLINEILDLSKIEAGKINLYLEELILDDLIQSVVTASNSLIESNNNQLHLELDEQLGTIYSDAVKIRQILLNLLSNAAKFTHNGKISLHVEREQASPQDVIIFRVADTGIGMNKQETARIFNAFTQADDSTTRRYGGTGLGLTISYRFCQLMGGTIAVESEPNKGSTFIVRLPARIDPQSIYDSSEESRAQLPSPSDEDGTTIIRPAPTKGILLVIHPNADERERIVRWMHQDGYRIYAAVDETNGWRLINKLQPLAIIMDVNLSKSSGWQLIGKLKTAPELAETPIIISSHLSPEEIERASHVATYIPQPAERSKILNAVNQSLYANKGSKKQPLQILIIEDNFAIRDLMRLMLEKKGYITREAADSLNALEYLQDISYRPDLIILDLMLPGIDGFEFLERVKRMPHAADIPIIVATAKQLNDDELGRLEHNVEHILHKGFYNPTELLHRVDELIQKFTNKNQKAEAI